MSDGPEDSDIWDQTLAALCDRVGSVTRAPAPGETAAIAALLGLQQIKARLIAWAEQLGRPVGENRFGPLVESALQLEGEFSGHVEALRSVADDLAAADRAGLPPLPTLQAAIEMPLNAVQTSVEALSLAQRAAALADAGPAMLGGAELLAAAARTMLHVVAPSIRRLPDAALAAEYRQSVDHFGLAVQDRYREIENLARRRAS